MFKIGVMASGGGSNFKAIIDRIGEGDLEAQCKFLITNNGGCGAVNHAKTYGVPVFHISGKTHPDQAEYEAALLEVIDKYDIDLLILAGYMKAIPTSILRRLPDRVLNIHPSLLPKFGGRGFYGHFVHEAVLAAGETESGPTIHLVSEEIDAGRILAQRKVPVMPDDTPEVLAARVLVQEHDLYWRTIKEYGEALVK
ncbi:MULTISPECIES: phosphoribosylglycinamide formyltransferase [unclassified Fibrobacter]|uniref:phosphoribosylglycinamide formyltransferase n=1 Tax=unclassified Fibrobacter TaxID=2634177 RepID=UPI000B5240EB|nr:MULTISPECIES: phosphoribosylglycinamide formyltransferase [Fibrobacter]MCL4101494.1 Phosphoribosylglycinamide formyltransferase [Fibrobacter succinogenes]MCQ2100842.1 phosphoribosylglycinamide formyltransferase [Fibrobacter sp.]MDO4946932.1 phosphoribosylglycinamide formyltransferase [Fibrobacter sp.]OWV15912.1 phosphoribosylglycinamide formyltransferase [Fibrobacter sp. UWH1]